MEDLRSQFTASVEEQVQVSKPPSILTPQLELPAAAALHENSAGPALSMLSLLATV